MKLRVVILCLLLGLWSPSVLANGNPTEYESMLFKVSNPTPRHVSSINVEREELYIQLGHPSLVRVKYLLHNQSDTIQKISYGFPVDYFGAGKDHYGSNFYQEVSYILGWVDDYIADVNFVLDGKQLHHTMSDEITVDKPTFTEEEFEPDMTEQDREELVDQSTISRRWFYTNFVVKPRETVTLEVSYAVYNFRFKTLDYYYAGPSRTYYFSYDMTPASNWGNGRAGELNITVDLSEINERDNENNTLYHHENPALPFKQQGDSITYTAHNFDFATSQALRFSYTLRNHTLKEIVEAKSIVPRDQYTITASQEVEAYPLSNLTDMDVTTAWAIPLSPQRRDSIVITFKKPVHNLYEIAILGGYHKSEKTYTENARPKLIRWVYSQENEMIEDTRPLECEDKAYNKFDLDEIYYNSHILDCSHHMGGYYKTDKVIIYLDEVFPGTKYKDLCISEILLLHNNEN